MPRICHPEHGEGYRVSRSAFIREERQLGPGLAMVRMLCCSQYLLVVKILPSIVILVTFVHP